MAGGVRFFGKSVPSLPIPTHTCHVAIPQTPGTRTGMAIHHPSGGQEALQALLRQIRRQAGLRQVDLAERLGQPQSFVSKYESGERRLDILELRMVCTAVGVSLQDFVARLEETLS